MGGRGLKALEVRKVVRGRGRDRDGLHTLHVGRQNTVVIGVSQGGVWLHAGELGCCGDGKAVLF